MKRRNTRHPVLAWRGRILGCLFFSFEPIEPPWQAIKEWIPADEPGLDWFYRPQNSSNPDPDGLDQSVAWRASEVPLDDDRVLVLEYS
jgi:hypothetical protein